MARHRKTKVQQIRPTINPYAAAADIGAREIFVAVPVELSATPVRRFETFTDQLKALVSWLVELKISTVALEATSVYWIPLAELLEEARIAVCLVNPRHVQNVSGRKSDVMDCQWLQYLHSVGLLRAAFRPAAEVRAVRALWRHRAALVRQTGWYVQHRHKALDQMNLQVHHVLTDITGQTGTAMVEAILAGERDPKKLAAFRDRRVKASTATLEQALTGDYRREHLFCLRQAYEAYQFTGGQIVKVEQELDTEMARLIPAPVAGTNPPQAQPDRKTQAKTPLAYPVQSYLTALYGVDLTTIPSIQALTAQTLWAELGGDLSAFPTSKHFCSWLSLCPDNRTSAGQCLSTKTRVSANRVAHALRMAAQSCHRAKHELGDYYRRMRARLGAAEGLVATAHKIARIVYAVLTTRRPYDPSLADAAQAQTKQRRVTRLHAMAKNLGFQLVPDQQTV
jgi:transposase